MTIDIQWIRHHPDQVRNWQQCRGFPESTVDQVIQQDQDARQALHTLRQYRQRLNSIAKELRTNRENATLLQERSQLQVLAQVLEDQVAEKKIQVQTLLQTLASPIDTVLLQQYPLLPVETNFLSSPTFSPVSPPSYHHDYWYQTNSLLWTALEFFGQKYSTRHVLRECDGSPPPVSTSSIISPLPVKSSPPSAADWKSWVSDSIPRKAIYGAKQLPQYTLLQRNSNQLVFLECLAMTAGALWDSRQIQLELASELQTFYQSLLSSISDINKITTATNITITLYALPTHQLEQHELSRVLLVAQTHPSGPQGQHGKQYILGWVSNFGDAHSRANDIRFRGGGLAEAKEFVYWVHATIFSPWTWHHLTTILNCHYGNENEKGSSNNNNYYNSHPVGVPAWAQRTNATNGEIKDVPAATTTMLSPPRFTTRLGIANHHSKPSRRMDLTLHSKSAEALSCPFGFLL